MLKTHLDAVEQQLLATSRIPANAGHMLHRGTPREAFIRQFLTGHLSQKLAVGSGEIIDAASLPRQPRNQFDIVIYRAEFPRIDLGGGIHAFLVESVVATIEIKSVLTQEDLKSAVGAASRAKKLNRNLVTSFTAGYIPPGILSYVVSYTGPANISTVYDWLKSIESSNGFNSQRLPPTGNQRLAVLSESLEGIFVLGMGSILFDNSPMSLVQDNVRAQMPDSRYQVLQDVSGNLMWLFLLLTAAGANASAQWPNLAPYLSRYNAQVSFQT